MAKETFRTKGLFCEKVVRWVWKGEARKDLNGQEKESRYILRFHHFQIILLRFRWSFRQKRIYLLYPFEYLKRGIS